MLAQVRNVGTCLTVGVIFVFAFALTSCATKKEVTLVDDADASESSIPWNKREKWEDSGPLSGLTDRR
jgi:hypothetical protein